MSFRDYLHEKAEESRHNEILAGLIFLGGAIFFVGGILETLSVAENPNWFLFIPYHTQPHAGAVLGLALIISGLSMIVFGIAAGIDYSKDRVWYMQELSKANSIEELMMSKKTAHNEGSRRKRKALKSQV